MWEHRLIERMVALLNEELNKISEGGNADSRFIETAVDFFRTYADRTHHGKEEDILFRELAKKQLSPEHKVIMDRLVADHIFGRKMVGSLSGARERYVQGNAEALKDIIAGIKELVKLYPRHIDTEDKQFFYPVLEYFTEAEEDKMLDEMWEFDRILIHEKYNKIVEELETGKS